MILWTIQHTNVYEELMNTGVFKVDDDRIEKLFTDAYIWLTGQMEKRISKAPDGVRFPVWAWYRWEGKRKRPDMRSFGRNRRFKGTPIILMTLDVPDNCVLLSDFDYWHFVLMNEAIEIDESDRKYSDEEKEKSWEYIFDIDCSFDGEEHNFISTQATMWEIKREWVLKSEHFISR